LVRIGDTNFPLGPTAAAVANAVYNAIGVRMRNLPMTPASVLDVLGRVPGRS